MDVRRNDPEVVTLVDDAIQLASVANPATVLVVQENRGTVVGTDLVEGKPGEVLITHYYPNARESSPFRAGWMSISLIPMFLIKFI
jgi:hypothetical protein